MTIMILHPHSDGWVVHRTSTALSLLQSQSTHLAGSCDAWTIEWPIAVHSQHRGWSAHLLCGTLR